MLVRPRIVNRHFLCQRAAARSRVAFHGVKLLGVWMPDEIEPEQIVVADGINDQRVFLPVPDGVSVPCGVGISGVLASIHENLPVAVDVALEKEVNVVGRLDDLPRIWRVTWYACRQAVGLRIVLRLVSLHHRLAGGREFDRITLFQAERNIFNEEDIAGAPDAGEVDASTGKARGGSWRRRRRRWLGA